MDSHASSLRWRLNTTTADITPPVVTALASPSILWPPNGRKVAILIGAVA